MKVNNKAFTLIELLAVIIIVVLITILVLPRIVDSVNNSAYKVDDALKEIIYNASDAYISNHETSFPKKNGNNYDISLRDLINDEILKYPIKNAKGKDITDKYCVYVHYNNSYEYEIIECHKSLKEVIELDKNHIKKNVLVNGKTVNKVYGTKDEQTKMGNYVWFSGQLWEVVETDDTNHSIKLVSPVSLTSIAYGTNNTWSTSWVRKWLNNVFYPILERTDLIVDTEFCLDNINVTPSSYTKMNTCTNKVNEKVGYLYK